MKKISCILVCLMLMSLTNTTTLVPRTHEEMFKDLCRSLAYTTLAKTINTNR